MLLPASTLYSELAVLTCLRTHRFFAWWHRLLHLHLQAALEPYDPLFFEEVLVPGGNPALAANIQAHTTVPLATGERMYTAEQYVK